MSLVVPACSRNAVFADWITPMTTPVFAARSTARSTAAAPEVHAALRRFVTDGIRATLDAYAAGTLPLHRFAWELDARITALAGLTALPHYRTLAALRTAQHTVATIDSTLRARTDQPVRDALTATEEHSLATAVTTLRTGLARLDPPDPIDPVEPTQPHPGRSGSVVIAFPVRTATTVRHAATVGPPAA
jgi:hypothetical protein